jgi:hypothetical protein
MVFYVNDWCVGRFLSIIGWDPSVCFHDQPITFDIFRFFYIEEYSFKTIGNFLGVLSLNRLSLKRNQFIYN